MLDALWYLVPLAFLAGLIDCVVGGGGLIQIPALLTGFPDKTVSLLFGTNKMVSVCGTTTAAVRFARQLTLPWGIALPAAGTAFIGSFAGARVVSLFPREQLEPVVLVLLIVMAIYTVRRKSFGLEHRPVALTPLRRLQALLLGCAIGFYDGFFGPGTGSLLIFLFIQWFGLDFLRASATAKIVNLATNLAALAYFLPTGNVWFALAVPMALANIAGAMVGTRLALRGGTPLVRMLFLGVVSVLILKLGWQWWQR
jgi:uncharacterized membrane protein YfcA